jgi:hypothetical protein
MDKIEFKNQEFKVREIEIPESGVVLISTNSLNEILLNSEGSYTSEEARTIDEQVFYFVEENEIEYSDEELINLITIEVR